MGMIQEFREFAVRGNVVDMAVGVVIGAAFGRIVTSFTNDLLMPPIGLITGGADFSNFALKLKEAVGDTPAVTLNYGIFINFLLDFLIIAFAVFLLVKAINAAKRKEEVTPETPVAPSREEVLLMEIRDALRAR